jgi:hypothetical protein
MTKHHHNCQRYHLKENNLTDIVIGNEYRKQSKDTKMLIMIGTIP